jgi:hypothetical protein
MNISAPKCAALDICTTKVTWYLTDPLLTTARRDRIPNIRADETLTYRDGKISLWKDLTTKGVEEDFRATLHRVERFALKPDQKADRISVYLVPPFLYSLTLAVIPASTI